MSVMELGHLLTRSGLTYLEVSSEVCHDSFCQFGNSVSLPCVDIEREWKTLQNILKSAANESLGTTKRQNRRKYLKIWDDQVKQLIETKKNHIENG